LLMPEQPDEPTLGKLITDATRDISTLVSKEIELAKSELRLSAKAGGAGAAMFVAAALFATLAVIVFSVAAAYLIHWNGRGLDLHWAFLIVAGSYLLFALLFALIGRSKVKKVKAPERAIYQAQETKNLLQR
jgi:hypothetical protein